MRLHLNIKGLVAALFVCAVGASQGSINQFSASYYISYTQESDSVPTTPLFHGFSAAMYTDVDNEATAATLTFPNASTQDFIFSPERLLILYSPSYSTLGDLVANYPLGNYDFNVTGGPLAGSSATLNVPPLDFSNEVPYFSNGSHSQLQNCPSGVDQPITCEPFTHSGGATNQDTNLAIFDYTLRTVPFFDGGPGNTYTGATIPGAILLSGHAYAYVVQFYSYYLFPNAGFGSATGTVTYLQATSGVFRVAANPGTVSGQLALDNYSYPDGYPIDIEVLDGETVVETQSIQLGNYFWYAFDTDQGGTKSVRFKAHLFLSRRIDDIDLTVGQDNVNANLLGGDCDDDNEVTLADYGILAAAFGSVPGDGNWNANADLNGDMEVSLADYGILATNFGMAGE